MVNKRKFKKYIIVKFCVNAIHRLNFDGPIIKGLQFRICVQGQKHAFSNSTMLEKEVVSTEVVKFNFGKLFLLLCRNSLNIPLVNLKHVKMFTKMKSRSPLELPNSNGSNYKGVQFGYFKLTSSKDFLGVAIWVKPFFLVIFQ